MAVQLKNDVKNLFWRIFGYESDSNVRIEEAESDEDEYGHHEEHHTVRHTRSGNPLRKRAYNSAAYASSSENYTKNLSSRSVSPPRHSTAHRTSHTNKNAIISFLQGCAGKIYYIASGQFLFEQLYTHEEHGIMTRRRKEQLEAERKKFSWMWLLGLLLLFLTLWWLLGSSNDDSKSIFSHDGRFAHVGDRVKGFGHSVFESGTNLGHNVYNGGATVYHWLTSPFYWILSKSFNTTKSIASHAGSFANFVGDDVKHLGHSVYEGGANIRDSVYEGGANLKHSVVEGGDTVYHWLTSPFYWIASKGVNTTKSAFSNAGSFVHFVGDSAYKGTVTVYHWLTSPFYWIASKGVNTTKTIASHAGSFAHFVGDDVKHISHSVTDTVSEGSDTVYHWFTSFLYWIVSQIVFGLLWIWHWFVAVLRLPYLFFVTLFHYLTPSQSLPPPPAYRESTAPPSYSRQEQQQHSHSSPPTPAIYNEEYAAKFNQWEYELDKIRKEVRSIGAVSQEADDARTAAAIDTQMRKLESVINELFEKERQMIRIEKEQLRKAIEERSNGAQQHGSHQHTTTDVHVSEEEIAKLVQQSISKLNLTSIVDQIVRYHVKTHISETERHSSLTSNEIIEKKIQTTIYDTLRRFNYDKTGEPDFALESAGKVEVY
uniref:Uncharacterized protein n=1 Tax=Panagrolaimus davidi TaxID=227884 RepID=A0A914PTE8_9BILA